MIGICGNCGIFLRRLELATGVQCHQVSSLSELAARASSWTTVVYLAGTGALATGGEVARCLDSAHCLLIAIVPPERRALRDISQLSQYAGQLEIAMLDFDLVESVIARARRAPRTVTPVQLVLSRLIASTETHELLMSVAAALLGLRKVNASALPRWLQLPERSVRRRLAQAALPSPGDYPALFTGAYLAFDTQVLDKSLRDIAIDRGFASTDDLRRYLVTRTGVSPSSWSKLGFERAVSAVTVAGAPLRDMAETERSMAEKRLFQSVSSV